MKVLTYIQDRKSDQPEEDYMSQAKMIDQPSSSRPNTHRNKEASRGLNKLIPNQKNKKNKDKVPANPDFPKRTQVSF